MLELILFSVLYIIFVLNNETDFWFKQLNNQDIFNIYRLIKKRGWNILSFFIRVYFWNRKVYN